MLRVASRTWRVFVVVGAALSLATSVAAQANEIKSLMYFLVSLWFGRDRMWPSAPTGKIHMVSVESND